MMPIRIFNPIHQPLILAVALLCLAAGVNAQPPTQEKPRGDGSSSPQTPPITPDSKKRRSHVVMNPGFDEIEALILEQGAQNLEAGADKAAPGATDGANKTPKTTAPRPEIPDSRSVLEDAHRTRVEGKHTINRAVRLFKAKGQGGRWKDKLMTALIVGGGGLLALVGCLALMRRRH